MLVIRLDATAGSTTMTSAGVPQQKYSAVTVQVRQSREQLPSSDIIDGNRPPVVMETIHNASTMTSLSSTAGESSSSSLQSILQSDSEFVRAAISIEGSKGTRQQQPATTSALTNSPTAPLVTRHRFVLSLIHI